MAGGVISNGYLRRRFQEMATAEDLDLFIPSPHLCTDNAVMIAWVGNHYLERGKQDSLDIDALSQVEGGDLMFRVTGYGLLVKPSGPVKVAL